MGDAGQARDLKGHLHRHVQRKLSEDQTEQQSISSHLLNQTKRLKVK